MSRWGVVVVGLVLLAACGRTEVVIVDGGPRFGGGTGGGLGGGTGGGGSCFIPSGIIAWWDGDLVTGTTAFDRVGTHHGTMQNGVQLAPGMVGSAFEFNRQSVIEVPFTTDLVPTSGLSIEGWVRPVGPQITWARIVGCRPTSTPPRSGSSA